MSSGGRGMFRKAIALAMVAGASCAGPSGALAAEADIRPGSSDPAGAQPFDGLPTASLEILAAQRGGLSAGGLDLAFTATGRHSSAERRDGKGGILTSGYRWSPKTL